MNYDTLDLWGFTVGILSFIIAFLYSFYLLQKFELNRRAIINILFLSGIGHFLGAFVYFKFAVSNGADSIYYFQNDTLEFNGFGYLFAFFASGYLKTYLLGESLFGAFLLSGAIGLIGSTYYLLTFKILLDKISGDSPSYWFDSKQLFYPALLLLCWPSYFFWSAGLIKDNFAFISIGMILFVIAQGKLSPSNLITFAIAALLAFMIRPYLAIIFAGSAVLYILLNSQRSIFFKIVTLCIIAGLLYSIIPYATFGIQVEYSGDAFEDAGNYAVRQQHAMNIGTTIPVPTQDPRLAFFFLPYLVLADLFLPLGIGANNLIGLISSVENAYLLFWVITFLRNRKIWKQVKDKIQITKFFMVYSLFGMSCLSIVNSNLGLAMREKMMYVPAMLFCILLTYAYRRMLLIQQLQDNV